MVGRRERMGFVFQTFNLIPYLTALENVQVPLGLNGVSLPNQPGEALPDAIACKQSSACCLRRTPSNLQ